MDEKDQRFLEAVAKVYDQLEVTLKIGNAALDHSREKGTLSQAEREAIEGYGRQIASVKADLTWIREKLKAMKGKRDGTPSTPPDAP